MKRELLANKASKRNLKSKKIDEELSKLTEEFRLIINPFRE
jgi:hypothetical protein